MPSLSILSWWMMHRSPKAERRRTRAKRAVDEEECRTVDAVGEGEGDEDGASDGIAFLSLKKFILSTPQLYVVITVVLHQRSGSICTLDFLVYSSELTHTSAPRFM
jgi:hypothetical protein